MNHQDHINDLHKKLDLLLKKQEAFSKEVAELQNELKLLKAYEKQQPVEKKTLVEEPTFKDTISTNAENRKGLFRDTYHRGLGGVCSGLGNYFGMNRYVVRFLWILLSLFFGLGFFLYIILWMAVPKSKTTSHNPIKEPIKIPAQKPLKISNELEKFIGENLINKIGIAILIIGVAIGAKYSIENDLISPLTRIILGYLLGLGLLGLSIKLKATYENFSAVLVSGSMAIFYFLTYAAYSYYELIPQLITFALMVIFTVFTVIAALQYNKQIIAHIGLVGAYAVPFLLSDNSGNTYVLFSYMAIINTGILVLAFKKYWKPLYYVSFVLTWLIYVSWFVFSYIKTDDFTTALTFASIFFILFYITFLVYKLIKKESFETLDIILLLTNSFVFYGLGFVILNDHETGHQLLGLFTLCNAMLHFIVSVVIFKLKLADKNLYYLIAGLVLVFITMAIPVQLDGHWVTLLWVGEAALLFWIGRTKQVPIYEYLSYPLMALATLSLYQDWTHIYIDYYLFDGSEKITPLLNSHFFNTVLFIAGFGFIHYLQNHNVYKTAILSKKKWSKWLSIVVSAIIISTVYFGFFFEIRHYFNSLYQESILTINQYERYSNGDILNFKTIWLLIYSMVFVSALSMINIKRIKNKFLGHLNLGLNGLVVLAFLFSGLYMLSELRESYLNEIPSKYYQISSFHIIIRYISFVFLAITLLVSYKYLQASFIKLTHKTLFGVLLQITAIWILSSELINLMDLSGSIQSHKLGLSISWGLYALFLIVLGIWKKKKYLRIGAIALFSLTLIKLFFYDIVHLETLSKTVVFVSLGILLLIISFLYNKFKNSISDDVED
ncbi:MAG: DUF2339 domain-containing protein [Flavobacteriales bacterium]|nr:DUF2339 domain-containing protein [Flavobacteriia bacterium]NCP04809.1 DUF2339 domain-containing protein [Flavobacteriales bacterium]PIV94254.1 MAG: DUF2339 domain-containing protein [Flavobacteriaceae bacterium CG17_big_fil_post_rev_8_21_14_2_50_33_15]PIY11925.1 MAG: DUF2339 domain-containing protein [Flavobacteriaceae bacterium CG_4_10_14_3_um_filter_33_47]PJB16255.1 MAG: DUF2339 domain-containing protein [Flavobacteriaceae bacterium CG_4_9_14_3_um_filter_33_16]